MSALPDRHFEQARRNREVAEYLLTAHQNEPVYVQWAVTAAFYCAVHCIQGYLLARGADPRSHIKRAEEIAKPSNQVPPDVQAAYEALKQYSEKARYRLAEFDPQWVRRRVLEDKLKIVIDFVNL